MEEILASIRQAISEDDAKRTNERLRSDPRALQEKKPVASVTSVFGDKKPEPEREEPAIEPQVEAAAAEPVTETSAADQEFIEHAIEQALDGVRAELENTRPTARVVRQPQPQAQQQAVEVGATVAAAGVAMAGAGPQRVAPRSAGRMAAVRREMPNANAANQRRALLSPRTDANVAASFEDLTKAMMGGNARKLDEVVEELLRPMLKGWLEGNLPQIVERLVREEIERVSRGRR